MSTDAPDIDERYRSAVRSSNLKSRPETRTSDTDVLGAFGLVAQTEPLSVELARLLAGDNKAARAIANILGNMAIGKAHRLNVKITPGECLDMGKAVLAWCRYGTCKPCGGLGYERAKGAPALTGHICKPCRGSGKRPFDREFKAAHINLARWLLAEVERDLAKAGPIAMQKLAPRLNLEL
jgi:hypothetical protein